MDLIHRANAVAQLRDYLDTTLLNRLTREHGSPLLILDFARLVSQYKQLQDALPGVKLYFALKASGHPAAVRAVAACNGYIDVATPGEVAMVSGQNFPLERTMHTHPVKKPAEIASAYDAGIRRFVIDTLEEVHKFQAYPEAELLLRLSFPKPHLKMNLSYKFGASIEESKAIIRGAQQLGANIVGFTMHVGSQIDTADAYGEAIDATLGLIEEMQAETGTTFRVLDVGGGFPVPYQSSVVSIEDIAAVIMPRVSPLMDRMEISAEPGRYIAAPAVTGICSIVGATTRFGKQWYYIDDGVYGSFSNKVFEGITPHVIALRELTDTSQQYTPTPSVLAGPTCDSTDIVSETCPLPELTAGDILVTPMLGAYSAVTATTFNSIPIPKIVVINES